MKKYLIFILLICGGWLFPAHSISNELIEDYMDIISNDCIIGDYDDAVKYLDRIIKITPDNGEYVELKALLYQLGTQNQKSFITGYNA